MIFNDIRDCIWVNNHYYVLKSPKTIEVYDNTFNHIKTLNTEMDYNLITYNEKEKSFYLGLVNNNLFLHKSNDFKTFKYIKLNISNSCMGEIKHIFYCKYLNGILIIMKKHILIFDLTKKCCKVLFKIKEKTMQPHDCMGPLCCSSDSNIVITDAICCGEEIFVVFGLGNMNFIAKLKSGELDEIVYKTNNFIKSILVVKNELWLLVDNGCYQQLINTEIECNCGHTRDCGIGIIESIASIEKSIAKILDSESLKIKAAIDKAEGINDLICVNSSVEEIIYYITILEFILSEKLKTVKNIGKEDC